VVTGDTGKDSDDQGPPGPVTAVRDAGDTAAAAYSVQDAADNSRHDDGDTDKKLQQRGKRLLIVYKLITVISVKSGQTLCLLTVVVPWSTQPSIHSKLANED